MLTYLVSGKESGNQKAVLQTILLLIFHTYPVSDETRHLSKHLHFVCNFTHISSFKGQQCYLYPTPPLPPVLSERQSGCFPSHHHGQMNCWCSQTLYYHAQSQLLFTFTIGMMMRDCNNHLFRTYSALTVTWKERVCAKLMLWLSLFYEGLSMKMNDMDVFWPTHI